MFLSLCLARFKPSFFVVTGVSNVVPVPSGNLKKFSEIISKCSCSAIKVAQNVLLKR